MAEIDYAAVLADLKDKRNALDSAIAGLEQWLSLKAGDVSVNPEVADVRTSATPGEVRSDTFFGMTIPDAIRACLKIMKQPQGLTELTQRLKEGGLLTSAKDLSSTVSATLTRMKRVDGDVVQVQGRWGLTQWYPGMRREKIEAVSKPKPKKKRRVKPSIGKNDPPAPVAARNSLMRPFEAKVTPEQELQIRQRADSGISQYAIAEEFGISRSGVQHILRRTPSSSDEPKLRVVPKPEEQTTEAAS